MRTIFTLMIATCCLGPAAAPVLAQQKPATASAETVSPEIRSALARMASALKALQSFEFKADITAEEVLDTGQKVQSSTVLTAAARRPDRMYMDVASERRSRRLYYDGKTVTLFGPVSKYYANVPAPPTTYAMLRHVAERYDLETPLADLFEWGDSAVRIEKVQSAFYAGPDRIGGQVCDHYAFRQDGADWQIWIPKAEPALPCKLVIANTDDPSQPQYSAVFTWTPIARLSEDRFSFTPPQGAHRIALRDSDSSQQKAVIK